MFIDDFKLMEQGLLFIVFKVNNSKTEINIYFFQCCLILFFFRLQLYKNHIGRREPHIS